VLLASACDAIGRCIAGSLRGTAILAGGGVRNRALVAAITAHAPGPVRLSDDLGIPAQAREAAAWAVLGALTADGHPVGLPQVTGAQTATGLLAGVWVRQRLG
jgi:anhydro-N-acetylmuramic acid kinase